MGQPGTYEKTAKKLRTWQGRPQGARSAQSWSPEKLFASLWGGNNARNRGGRSLWGQRGKVTFFGKIPDGQTLDALEQSLPLGTTGGKSLGEKKGSVQKKEKFGRLVNSTHIGGISRTERTSEIRRGQRGGKQQHGGERELDGRGVAFAWVCYGKPKQKKSNAKTRFTPKHNCNRGEKTEKTVGFNRNTQKKT